MGEQLPLCYTKMNVNSISLRCKRVASFYPAHKGFLRCSTFEAHALNPAIDAVAMMQMCFSGLSIGLLWGMGKLHLQK